MNCPACDRVITEIHTCVDPPQFPDSEVCLRCGRWFHTACMEKGVCPDCERKE